jgi:multiple sugar transport system substrate-binding protein
MRGDISTYRASAPSATTRPGRQGAGRFGCTALICAGARIVAGATCCARSGLLLAARVAGLLFVLSLAACGGTDSGTTIRFWMIGREGEVVAQLLPAFERAHPGVRIEIQQIPLTASHEKLLTAFAGDALPDICQLGNTWIPEFAALGALEPLQPFVDASTVVRSDDYFPGIWDTNVIDGRLYGVPWYVDTRLLFYRTDLLAKAGFDHAPRDWDEWRRAMSAIKVQGGAEKYSIFLPLNEFEPLLGLALQQSDPLLRDNGTRGNFESAGFRRALAFYVEMFRSDWAPPMSNMQISNVWEEFARGFFAFYHRTLEHLASSSAVCRRLRQPVEHGAAAGIRGHGGGAAAVRASRSSTVRRISRSPGNSPSICRRSSNAAEILRTDR